MKITGSMNYVKFDLENGYVVKAEGEMLIGKKFVAYRDTMKFWEPPHEHEELLEEQIESIIQGNYSEPPLFKDEIRVT